MPLGAANYLERVYGEDWNTTVRPHGWASQHGEGFEPKEAKGWELGGRFLLIRFFLWKLGQNGRFLINKKIIIRDVLRKMCSLFWGGFLFRGGP